MKTHLLSITIVLIIALQATGQPTPQVPEYVTAYLQLKDALHFGDVVKTTAAAGEMNSKISSAGIEDEKKIESINSALSTISSAQDIEAQRTAFAKLSQFMITILENNPVSDVVLYSDYCPMARDGKGAYWISTEKEISNNPYMGIKMPRCGTLDEKISK